MKARKGDQGMKRDRDGYVEEEEWESVFWWDLWSLGY